MGKAPTKERVEKINEGVMDGPHEKVFMCTNPKPVETTVTFPESLLGSDNNYDLFLDRDPEKLNIFKNFK